MRAPSLSRAAPDPFEGASDKHRIGQNKKGGAKPRLFRIRMDADQRFENWKLRRALARPYFLRSTTRLSRVRKPPFLSGERSSGS